MSKKNRTKIKSPFNNNLFLGYISKVTTRGCDVHFPNASLLRKFWHEGQEYTGGIIGSYIVVEGENHGFLAVIQEVGLSEKDVYSLDKEQNTYRLPFHPDGKAEVLLSFDYFDLDVKKGLDSFPVAGSKVYLCPQEFLAYLLAKADSKLKSASNVEAVFKFCTLNGTDTDFAITPNSLFERHCAIVGTTGGGKSYTIAQLISQIIEQNVGRTKKQKCILIDATGEFKSLVANSDVESYHFGARINYSPAIKQTYFHYSNLRVADLTALFRPGGQMQRPKLLEAIKSLKLSHLLSKQSLEQITSNPFLGKCNINKDGNLIKALKDKADFKAAYQHFVSEIESDNAEFDVRKLNAQVRAECIYDFDRKNPDDNKWGDYSPQDINTVSSLVARIEHTVHDPNFSSVFCLENGLNYDRENEFSAVLSNFLKNDNSILLLALDNVSFDFGLREILVNAVGRILLEKARKRDFSKNPLILFLDEAHQFLKKSVKDEYFAEIELDSFDKIAKECRKHGLYLAISTQMPRDIPDGTLSQMGTFIVHRLINEKDREKIHHACSEANRHSLSYLPVLGEGVALLVSVSLPMPVLVKIKKPELEPDSKSPKLFSS